MYHDYMAKRICAQARHASGALVPVEGERSLCRVSGLYGLGSANVAG